jgi:hypothetical protein
MVEHTTTPIVDGGSIPTPPLQVHDPLALNGDLV